MNASPPCARKRTFWLGLSIALAVCVPVTFLLATVTASAAQGPCAGSFAVFHEVARCRWPAIFSRLSLACIAGLGVAIAMALRARRTNEDRA